MDADVIVIGAGPSGLTVASEIAKSGARVIVLERRTGVVESRAGSLLPRVLELFDARGIADRFIKKARMVKRWPFNGTHIWAGLEPVDWSHIDSRYGFTLVMPQNLTEEVLLGWSREEGVDIRFGQEVEALGETDEGVFVQVQRPGGETVRLTARYIVGADGARSIVRKTLSLPFEGSAPTFTGIVADAVLDYNFSGGWRMLDNENGWAMCYPFGEGITRFVIVHAERRAATKDEPLTIEEFRRCVKDILGNDLQVEKLAWGSRFTDQMRITPSFRKGRAFLVGESARIHYPASGIGMNFCIQDSFNLGWKLGYVLQGQAPEALLDTYDTERRPVALELLKTVRSQCAMQFNFTADGITQKRDFKEHILPIPEVNRKIGLELNGLGKRYSAPAGSHVLTGDRVPDADLIMIDGSVSRIGALLRRQRFVLLDMSGVSAFSELVVGNAPVDIVEARGVMLPSQMRRVQAMLIRPDGYVAWVEEATPTASSGKAALSHWLTLPEGL